MTWKSRLETNKATLASALILAVLLVRTVFAQSWPIRNDCAMYLRCAELLLQGKTPYIDFVDLNPPLIMYVMTLPAVLAQSLHIDIILAFNLFIFALICASWLALKTLLDKHSASPSSAFFPIILVGFALANLFTGEWHEFGQRDHLFALIMVPYFFLRWLRWGGYLCHPLYSSVAGILMGLAICMRPYFIFMLAIEEVFWLATKHKIKPLIAPEILSILVTGSLYFAALKTLLPAPAQAAWVEHIVPIALKGYETYDQPLPVLMLLVTMYGVLPALILSIISVVKARTELTVHLIVLTASSILVYFWEMKPWANHLLPALFACSLLSLVQWQSLVEKYKPAWTASHRNESAFYCASIALLFITFMPYALIIKAFQTFDLNQEKALILKETGSTDSVMILSLVLPNSYPTLLETGRKDGSRYFFLFPLSMLQCAKEKSEDKDSSVPLLEENRVMDELFLDLHNRKPKLVLIEDDKTRFGGRMSVLGVLEERHFVTALQRDYEQLADCKACTNLKVYRRKN